MSCNNEWAGDKGLKFPYTPWVISETSLCSQPLALVLTTTEHIRSTEHAAQKATRAN